MNLPAALDVAIGLVVLYFLLSVACSFAVELLASLFWWRKTLLYQTIGRLLTDRSNCRVPTKLLIPKLAARKRGPDLLEQFWNHPLATALSQDKKLPSYIEPATFAAIAADLAVPGITTGTVPTTAEGLERLLRLASTSGEENLRPLRRNILTTFQARRMSSAVDPGAPPLDELRAGIEKWYNEAMARASGEYKRWAQSWLLIIGLILAAAFNADTIRAVYALSTNESLRTATATYAATVVANSNAVTPTSIEVTNLIKTNELAVAELKTNLVGQLKELQNLQRLGFPLAWRDDRNLNFLPFKVPAAPVAKTSDNRAPASTNDTPQISATKKDDSNRKAESAPNEPECSGAQWILPILFKTVGLVVTGLAVSLGAPFWFDLLSKLVSLRSSGNRIPTPTAPPPSENPAKSGDRKTLPPVTPPPGPGTALIPSADFQKDLADARTGFNPRKAYWLAEASLLAYSAQAPVTSAVQQWGLKLIHFFEKVEACQGFLAMTDDKKIAVLAFRGTEKKLDDWKTDAEFKLTDSPAGVGKTHHGITTQLERVYADIIRELTPHLQPDTLLYITGHSLGAALATLMAVRLAKDKTCGVQSVHTFGSPRVGESEFARAYELVLGHCTYRVVNAEDLVTRVPPRFTPAVPGEYAHVGQVVYFDSDGRMQLNVSFWERFLNTVIKAVEDFRAQLKSSLKDHSMDEYVRLLKQQLKS